MATQPQKDNLIKLFEESIDSNLRSIESNQISLQETQLIIDDFDPSCKGIDNLIIPIIDQINNLKVEIVSLHNEAYNVGCGTTVGVTKIYPDTVIDSSYNLSDPSYESVDAYDVNNQQLSNSNVGFGTFVIHIQNNSLAVGLGSAYANLSNCYRKLGTCNTGTCNGYVNQITEKQNQINILRSDLNELTLASNSLRTRRLDYQVRRWADRYTIKILTDENVSINQAISILNDPKYDPYI